ncbi:MAG: DUF937 domain-containing protein [Gemmatimonadetes bacterium]|nr:DUF937 domain-containing protein [Gemmatimonadota bacterium]
MQISDILAQLGGTQAMAKELGVSEAQVASGAAALGPALLGGFQKQVQAGGVEGLGALLGQLGGGGLLDNLLSPAPTDVGQGNAVLGQIFGSKEVSRAVAQHAAAQSGLDPSLLRKMLPMLAMALAGFMAKQQQGAGGGGGLAGALGSALGGGGGGGLGGLIGGMLGGGGGGAGGLGGLLGQLAGGSGGNPLDEILGRMGGR